MTDELYTIKDIAKQLGVGESTIRFWRDRYSEHIPSVGTGKRKRYRSEALEVFRFIQERTNRSEPQENIKKALNQEFPVNIELQKESQRSTAAAPQQRSESQAQEILQTQEIVKQLVAQLQEQKFNTDIINMILHRLDTLEKEVKELKQKKKSFWSRFKKK